MNTLQPSRAGGFIHCTQWLSDMWVIPHNVGWIGKSSQGKWRRTAEHWGSWQEGLMALEEREDWVGEEILSGREWQRQAGRIRAVQWEANPKGGMEGAAGGVDKMSRLWERSEDDSAWLGSRGPEPWAHQGGLRTKHGRPRCPQRCGSTAQPGLKTLLKCRRWPLPCKGSVLNSVKG